MSIIGQGIKLGMRGAGVAKPYLDKIGKDVEFGLQRVARRVGGLSGSVGGAGSTFGKAFPRGVLESIDEGSKKFTLQQKTELRKIIDETRDLSITQSFGRLVDFFSKQGIRVGVETTKLPKNWADIKPWDLFRLKTPYGDVVLRVDNQSVLNELQKMESKGKKKEFAKTFFNELLDSLKKGTTAPPTNASGVKTSGNFIEIKTAPHSTFGDDRLTGIKMPDDIYVINTIDRGVH